MIGLELYEKIKEGKSIFELNLRVVYYARVSTDHLLQASSIVNQVDFFERYIRHCKNWVFVRGYVDEGVSGKNAFKRIQFLQMIRDAKEGKFDFILTKSVSRFARNTIDSISYTDVLFRYGVGVFFLNDNINTLCSDSEFRLTLMASIAQDELRKLSESVQFGLRQSIERGVVLGNNNLLGYCKCHGKLKIIRKEALIVKDTFHLFVSGNYSYSSLAREINSRYGVRYDSSRIKRILTNYKYKGFYCGRKSKVIDYKRNIRKNISSLDWVVYRDYDNVPPIVSEEVWDEAQLIIQGRKRVRSEWDNIFYCAIHHKKLLLKRKKYKNRFYQYLVCQHCIHISISFLGYFLRFKKVLIYPIYDNLYYFYCKK